MKNEILLPSLKFSLTSPTFKICWEEFRVKPDIFSLGSQINSLNATSNIYRSENLIPTNPNNCFCKKCKIKKPKKRKNKKLKFKTLKFNKHLS